MGFECSFNRVKKFKNTTVADFKIINAYLNWKNNPWNFEEGHYPTFEKYWNGLVKGWDDDTEYPGEPDMEAVAFYDEQPHDEYSYEQTIDFWCSSGRYIDEFVTQVLQRVDEYTFIGIDDTFFQKAYKWIEDQLADCNIKPAFITHAFKENEDGTTTLIPCDGIFVEDEEGNQRMINTSDEEWSECIYIPSRYFDEDRWSTLNQFKETIDKLTIMDRDNYLIWYSRGY